MRPYEALQRLDVVAALQQLLLKLGEPALPLQWYAASFGSYTTHEQAVYLVGQVPCHTTSAGADARVCSLSRLTQSSPNLVGFAQDEQIDAVMLSAQFCVELILEPTERRVTLPRDRDRSRLVLARMGLDVVFQRVIVDIV